MTIVPPFTVGLYWIPLGAGGVGFVRWNGRMYEAVQAFQQGRPRQPLYHTAVELYGPHGRYIVENAWPSPNADTRSRGVVLEGPVFSRRLFRFRPFRYEVRCWLNGEIPDIGESVDSPQILSIDPAHAQRVLDAAAEVPQLVWGRDELRSGAMWNSNSVIAWVLARGGFDLGGVHPPDGGRAPGWEAGLAANNRPRMPASG